MLLRSYYMRLAIIPIVDNTDRSRFALLARRGNDAAARTEATDVRHYAGADCRASGRGAGRSAADPVPVAQAEGSPFESGRPGQQNQRLGGFAEEARRTQR
jgi:hypothetical protein